MNKKEFLKELKKEIFLLPKDEKEEIINYYFEYINEITEDGTLDISDKVEPPKEIAKKIIEEYYRDLERAVEVLSYSEEEKESLEEYINYSDQYIKTLIYPNENQSDLRRKSFNNFISEVERNLDKDEEIIIKTIIMPDKNMVVISNAEYYVAYAFTNKRMFVLEMNYRYEKIKKLYVSSYENIKYIQGNKDTGAVKLICNDTSEFIIRSYIKEEYDMALIILKYLTEQGVEFQKSHKFMGSKEFIGLGVFSLMLIMIIIFKIF